MQTFNASAGSDGRIILAPGAAPAVPEPSSFALLGLGLPALGLMACKRRSRNI